MRQKRGPRVATVLVGRGIAIVTLPAVTLYFCTPPYEKKLHFSRLIKPWWLRPTYKLHFLEFRPPLLRCAPRSVTYSNERVTHPDVQTEAHRCTDTRRFLFTELNNGHATSGVSVMSHPSNLGVRGEVGKRRTEGLCDTKQPARH